MKCQFCGANLGLEDELCPFCGRENSQAAGHVKVMKGFRKEYDNTKKEVTRKSRRNHIIARIICILLMLAAAGGMLYMIGQYSDIEVREARKNKKLEQEVAKNKSSIEAALNEMEKNREYLEMSYYVLNYRLSAKNQYRDYSRVFTACNEYESIFSSILNILSGYDYFGEKTPKDWCDDIAGSISGWNLYADGEFWHDSKDSPMHAGEHGAFLADIKQDTQKMVQVYFDLTDEQAEAMWKMEQEEIGRMLYEQYEKITSGVSANE